MTNCSVRLSTTLRSLLARFIAAALLPASLLCHAAGAEPSATAASNPQASASAAQGDSKQGNNEKGNKDSNPEGKNSGPNPAPNQGPRKPEAPASPASAATLQLHAAPAQLRSWPLAVFVATDLTAAEQPVLKLHFGHSVRTAEDSYCVLENPQVQRHAKWMDGPATMRGVETQNAGPHVSTTTELNGTLLLFNAEQNTDKCHIPLSNSVTRVRPQLLWQQPGCTDCSVIAEQPLLLGTPLIAAGWSALLLIGFTGLLKLLCGRQHRLIELLLKDGRLSLAKWQMALWTYAIGFVLLYIFLLRLDFSSPPETLYLLMFSATATAWISRLAGPPLPPAGALAMPLPETRGAELPVWRWSDLLSAPDGDPEGARLALSRAQMFFWTVVLALAFVVKSMLLSAVWSIPIEVLALMGVSQLGYLGGKYGGGLAR
ncbi:hypothetical protein RQP53_09895 [Paucibacter sp. APW11]|uniref:Uncharacterized protein n=1 Tax=Roseateles aquae TaxID=3077235 RepID=A0ABU3PAI0_9BURK|nr:hypothetical protein [Paucibacter sp. APW11]MDT8999576.1 hypothetical protein [Paucibacter sp. APW11]